MKLQSEFEKAKQDRDNCIYEEYLTLTKAGSRRMMVYAYLGNKYSLTDTTIRSIVREKEGAVS